MDIILNPLVLSPEISAASFCVAQLSEPGDKGLDPKLLQAPWVVTVAVLRACVVSQFASLGRPKPQTASPSSIQPFLALSLVPGEYDRLYGAQGGSRTSPNPSKPHLFLAKRGWALLLRAVAALDLCTGGGERSKLEVAWRWLRNVKKQVDRDGEG